MSNIAFVFEKQSQDESIKVEVYKDGVLRDDVLEINDVQPNSNPLSVTFDELINEDNNGSGPHTIKLVFSNIGDDNVPLTATLNRIEIDGITCDPSNEFLKEHIKVYSPFTWELAAPIAEGSIESEGTETVDLGVGQGVLEYYHYNYWQNAGTVNIGSVIVLSYEGNFTEWFDSLGLFQT